MMIILSVLFAIIFFVASFVLTSSYDQIPIRWAVDGEVTHYGSHLWIYIMGLLPLLGIGVLEAFRKFHKYNEDIKNNMEYYKYSKYLVFFSLAGIALLTLMATVIPEVNYTNGIYILFGFVFVGIGLLLGNIPQNRLIGIRVPWTINNKEVWEKTHVLGRKIFILAGLFFILTALFLSLKLYVFIISLGIIVVVITVYSYKISRD